MRRAFQHDHLEAGNDRTHSSRGFDVPVQRARDEVEQYCAAAVAAGNHCTLVGYDGANHGFFNRQVAEGRWFRETLDEADRFLVSHGFLAPRAR
jgi:acetyl esterase/lipase